MRVWTLSLLLVATACAQPAQPPAAAASPECAEHSDAFPALIGQTELEVRAALATMPGIHTIRLLAPNQPATFDFRSDRVTGLVRDGRVESLNCG